MDELATGDSETQDFMNVETTFSHIPLIRPEDNKNPKPIRLFGKYFTGQEHYSENQNTQEDQDEESQTGDNGKDNISIKRSLECHFCYRNFPTSQALGGHQNAHKRERQLAKRCSSSSFFHHHLDNNHRHYPSWNTALRSYGGGFNSGYPSSAYYTRPWWRLPSSSSSSVQGVYNSNAAFTSRNNYSSSVLPLLADTQPQPPGPPLQVGGSEAHNRILPYGLSPNMQELSLDLHL